MAKKQRSLVAGAVAAAIVAPSLAPAQEAPTRQTFIVRDAAAAAKKEVPLSDVLIPPDIALTARGDMQVSAPVRRLIEDLALNTAAIERAGLQDFDLWVNFCLLCSSPAQLSPGDLKSKREIVVQ